MGGCCGRCARCAGGAGVVITDASDLCGKSTLVLSGRLRTKTRYRRWVRDPLQRSGDDRAGEDHAKTKIPEDVTFEARTAAASPILTIEATADDPNVAQDAALHMAAAFSEDVNAANRPELMATPPNWSASSARYPPWRPTVRRIRITPPCGIESTRRGPSTPINFWTSSHGPASPRQAEYRV